MRITDIHKLKAGQTYLSISHQFNDARNRITIICGDFLGLNRDICYAFFTDRVSHPITENEFINRSKNNQMTPHCFAIWGSDLKDLRSLICI